MIDMFGVDCVINVGVAGSLSGELQIGDVVVSSDAVQHDMDVTGFGYPRGVIPRMPASFFESDRGLAGICSSLKISGYKIVSGRIASGDQFVSDAETKNRIRSEFGALCVEMEGAAIAQAASLNSIPFLIIRSISDNADGDALVSFDQFVLAASQNSALLVKRLIEEIA